MRINTGAELELRLHLPQTMPSALEPGVFSRALCAPELTRLPKAEMSAIATKPVFLMLPGLVKRLSSLTERSSRSMSLVRGSPCLDTSVEIRTQILIPVYSGGFREPATVCWSYETGTCRFKQHIAEIESIELILGQTSFWQFNCTT